jgi:hypothetical protein
MGFESHALLIKSFLIYAVKVSGEIIKFVNGTFIKTHIHYKPLKKGYDLKATP